MIFLSVQAQVITKLGDNSIYIKNVEKQFNTATTDSLKAYTALKLSYLYKREKDTAKVNYYLKQGLKLAKGNEFLEAATHYYSAFARFGEPDTDNLLLERQLRKGDSLLQPFQHAEAYKIRSNCWIVLGVLAQMQGDEENALDAYLNHALPLAKKSEDPFLTANAGKFIGIIFLNAGEREKAAGYLKNALASFETASSATNPNKQEAIAETTIIIAENNVYLNQLEEAKAHLDKAKKILAPYPESNLYLFYYLPEGVYYERSGQYKKAISSFDKGIAIGGGGTTNHYVNRMKYGKFETLLKMQKYSVAIGVMRDLLKSPILLPLDKRVYMKKLADAYTKTGNLKEANQLLEEYIAFRDSLYEAGYEMNLLELEKKYQTAQKEKKIISLEAEKQASDFKAKTAKLNGLLWSIGCILLLVTAAFLFYFLRNNKKLAIQKELNHKQQLQNITRQQELQLAQAMLTGEEKERQRLARELHDGLGGTLTGIKLKLSSKQSQLEDDVMQQLDSSIDELRRIARNMMPETLIRSGLNASLQDLCASLSSPEFDIEFQSNGIENNLPVNSQVNIYRIVQELLSNAIRHSKADTIIVQCLQNKDAFLITVEDNGQGIKPSQPESAGIGLTNIRNRVNYMKGDMKIDSAENNGTTVNITLYV